MGARRGKEEGKRNGRKEGKTMEGKGRIRER